MAAFQCESFSLEKRVVFIGMRVVSLKQFSRCCHKNYVSFASAVSTIFLVSILLSSFVSSRSCSKLAVLSSGRCRERLEVWYEDVLANLPCLLLCRSTHLWISEQVRLLVVAGHGRRVASVLQGSWCWADHTCSDNRVPYWRCGAATVCQLSAVIGFGGMSPVGCSVFV